MSEDVRTETVGSSYWEETKQVTARLGVVHSLASFGAAGHAFRDTVRLAGEFGVFAFPTLGPNLDTDRVLGVSLAFFTGFDLGVKGSR